VPIFLSESFGIWILDCESSFELIMSLSCVSLSVFKSHDQLLFLLLHVCEIFVVSALHCGLKVQFALIKVFSCIESLAQQPALVFLGCRLSCPSHYFDVICLLVLSHSIDLASHHHALELISRLCCELTVCVNILENRLSHRLFLFHLEISRLNGPLKNR